MIAFRPSHPSFPIVITIFMPPNIAQVCCTKKPTVGFPARFILEGPGRREWLGGNGLRLKKYQKTVKTQKKVSFCWARTPVFLPNSPKKRPFFLSIIALSSAKAAFSVAAEELAPVLAARVFSNVHRVQPVIGRWWPGRRRR